MATEVTSGQGVAGIVSGTALLPDLQAGAGGPVSGEGGLYLGDEVFLEEEELRPSAGFNPDETLFRVLGSSPTVAIFRADLRGNLLYANERFCEIWRQPLDALLGLGWTAWLHPEDRRLLASWAWPRPRAAFWRLMFADGSVLQLSGQQSILHDEHGRPVGKVGTILDITESEQSRRFDVKRNGLLEAVASNEPTRVPLRLMVEALEEQCSSCQCVLIFIKNEKPFVTVGERVSERLQEAIQQDMEVASTVCLLRSPDAGLRMLKAVDIRSAQRDFLVLTERLGVQTVQEMEIYSASGHLIGSIHLLVESVGMASDAALLMPRHQEVLHEVARLATLAYENRQKFHRLVQRAQHDPMTELPNRLGLAAYLADRLEEVQDAPAAADWRAGLLCIDVDRFKKITDLLGHAAADELLRLITARLQGCVGADDLLAHMTGDQFVMLLGGVETHEAAIAMAQRIGAAMHEPFVFGHHEVSATVSIGISLYPQDGGNLDELLLAGQRAMLRAKKIGKGPYEVFLHEHESGMAAISVEALLRRALREGLFELHYQPQYTANGELAAFEALLRLRYEGRLLSPGEFIGVAEESGLIVPIGRWVLMAACVQNEKWRRTEKRPIRLAVNVSALQFARTDFPELVMEVLRESRLPPHLLELELTETVVMARIEETADQMRQLAAAGVRFAIDDFGTGFSSLHYLHRLPVQTLKIDRSFVTEMLEPAGTGPLVKGIISLAHSLRLEVVAEGVETRGQCEALVAQGCDLLQGFYYAEPLDSEAAAKLFQERRS